jgi:hypothetical protein
MAASSRWGFGPRRVPIMSNEESTSELGSPTWLFSGFSFISYGTIQDIKHFTVALCAELFGGLL